jgi:PAS domain S-box-containing protein
MINEEFPLDATATSPKESAVTESQQRAILLYGRAGKIFVALVFVVIAVGLIWNAWSSHRSFVEQNNSLIKNSINGAQSEIQLQLNELRRSIVLVGERDHNLLRHIVKNPEDFDAYDKLVARVRSIFPESFAVTIADSEGVPFVEDYEGYIVQACKNDIRHFARERVPPDIYIHPNPFQYHFDIMQRVDIGLPKEVIFFVSFQPDVFAQVLKNSQLFQHKLYLLHREHKGLLEVHDEGSRQGLPESGFFIDKNTLADIKHKTEIAGTKWLLADIPQVDEQQINLEKVIVDTSIEFASLLVISLIMLLLLLRAEKRVIKQNSLLLEQTADLKKKEQRLARAQQIANLGYWEYDLITEKIYLSDGALKIFGLQKENYYDTTILLKIVSPRDRAHVRRVIARCVARGRISQLEFTIQRYDGHSRVLFGSAELSHDKNEKPYIVAGVVQDISERKDAEEQAKKAIEERIDAEHASQAKTAFLANMSHEIRTPLTAIIGFAETLLESEQTVDERIASIRTIIGSGKHLLQIINDILDLSKIEADKLELERIETKLFQLLYEVEALVKTMATAKQLQFSVDYKFPLPEKVLIDPLRLKQVLINLCSNAIKFTNKGSVHVAVEYVESSNRLLFKVTDTGIGMSAPEISRIFSEFSQADSSTSRRFGGTGLGLSLSRKLVHMMGGDIRVQSVPNQGSTFSAEIDAGVIDDTRFIENSSALPRDETEVVDNAPRKKLQGHVLLAEDVVANQKLISLYLRKLGLTATIVENGKLAVLEAQHTPFDLILMDIQMPIMDGLEATRAIRTSDSSIPVIALTANAMQGDRERCMQAGCDDFLSKPIQRSKLYALLSKYLAEAKPEKQTMVPLVSALVDDEPEMLDIVIGAVNKLPAQFEEIKVAAQTQRWNQLKSLVHQVKGVGGGIGYPLLTEVSAQIEFQLLNRNYAEVTQLIERLENVCHRILAGLPQLEQAYKKAN